MAKQEYKVLSNTALSLNKRAGINPCPYNTYTKSKAIIVTVMLLMGFGLQLKAMSLLLTAKFELEDIL